MMRNYSVLLILAGLLNPLKAQVVSGSNVTARSGSSTAKGAQGQASEPWAATNVDPAERKRSLQRTWFSRFSGGIANQELKAKRHLEEGTPTVNDRVNYTEIVGLHGNEEQIMRTILFDAFTREAEVQRQFSAPDGSLTMHTYEERIAKSNAESRDLRNIYEEAITRLKQQFGAEDFNKLVEYIADLEGGPERRRLTKSHRATGGVQSSETSSHPNPSSVAKP